MIRLARIERLPEDLVNKIAAGEVVERPASVVKELVENALDAGALRVVVEIEAGGKASIRVSDDGLGMGREDAERAVERHATSKLRTLSDLQSIATHGFRGEALPAIASVSHLRLRTCEPSSPVGTEVEVRYGGSAQIRDVGHPRGTVVEVSDLFGAVPARRKFLRAESTEAGHVAEALTLLALARPGTSFFLSSGGRSVVEAPSAGDLKGRVYQLFGGDLLDSLVAVEGGEAGVKVRGLVSRPDGASVARPTFRLFVNGRAVRDRALSKAVSEAYRRAGAEGRAFAAFLFLETPLHMVDVNVHPAKTEIRFADPRSAFRAVEESVAQSLSLAQSRAPRADTQGVVESVERSLALSPSISAPWPTSRQPPEAELPQAGSLGAPALSQDHIVLGQHRNTYIVVTDGEELILLDQHTAHERVRYEALLDRHHPPECQMLLAPRVLKLAPRLYHAVEEHGASLVSLGFDLEPFGNGAVRLGAVPAVLEGKDPAPVVERLLGDLLEKGNASGGLVLQERLLATLACHSAVRAGQSLSRPTMTAIVADLAATRHPTLCPHGRPTSVRIPRQDLSGWFGRKGWGRQ